MSQTYNTKTDENAKTTMVIKEPLQSAIVKVANGKVYMTGKKVLTIDDFLAKFFAYEKHKIKTVVSSKLGFAIMFKKANLLPVRNQER
jgi:hypothetical protein